MSVYTSVSESELQHFLSEYAVGDLIHFSGIEAGVENTNYFVTTSTGEYVLTIYEDLTVEELPFFLGLMQHLSAQGVATVKPVLNTKQQLISELCNKPAAFVERLDGGNEMQPRIEHCALIGEALAKVHLAGLSYKAVGCRDQHRETFLKNADKEGLCAKVSVDEAPLLKEAFAHSRSFDFSALPQGIIHSDLFRDNCIFQDENPASQKVVLSGVIDFYYACNGPLLYDLAVAVNDWCFTDDGAFDINKYHALVNAYDAVRPITELEKQHWVSVLRIAALYFWVFRLLFNLYPPEGECVGKKDASAFQKKIQWILRNQDDLNDVFLSNAANAVIN